MSQGTFSDTLIRFEALKRIFCISYKHPDFFQGVSPRFWSKMPKLLSWNVSLLYVPSDLGVS